MGRKRCMETITQKQKFARKKAGFTKYGTKNYVNNKEKGVCVENIDYEIKRNKIEIFKET